MAVRRLSRYQTATPEAADVYAEAAQARTGYKQARADYEQELEEQEAALKEQYKTGGTEEGAMTGFSAGASSGAAIGSVVSSVVPGIGTAIGALVGALVGGGVGAAAGAGGGALTGAGRAEDVTEGEALASSSDVRAAKKKMLRKKAAETVSRGDLAAAAEANVPTFTRAGGRRTRKAKSRRVHQPGRMLT